MSLLILNSTAYAVYTPVVSNDDEKEGEQDEEDEDDQSRNCEESIDDGTSTCAWISRPEYVGLPIQIGAPPDIQPTGGIRGRVERLVTGIVGSPGNPPPRGPVPRDAQIVRSRGARHGIHRVVRIPMDVQRTRFVRIWNVALDRRGRVLSAITFLFELRRRPRGGGYESVRLIERTDGAKAHVPRVRAKKGPLAEAAGTAE